MTFLVRNLADVLRLAPGSAGLFLGTVCASLFAAGTEAVGILIFLPLLQSTGAAIELPRLPMISGLLRRLDEVSFTGRVQVIAVVIIAVVLLRAALEFINKLMINAVRMMVQQRLAEDIYCGILYSTQSYIDRQRSGRMTAQVENFVFQISRILGNAGTVLFNALLLATYLVMMIAVSMQLTLFGMAIMALVSALVSLVLIEQDRLGRRLVAANVEYHNMIAESIVSMRLVRLLAGENARAKAFDAIVRRKTWLEFLMYSVHALIQPVFTLSGGLFFAGALLFGAWYFADESRAWLPSAILMIVILYRMIPPVSAINAARAELKGDMPTFEELQRFRTECRNERFVNGTIRIQRPERQIRYENVSFSYDATAAPEASLAEATLPQLVDFNLEVRNGQMVALVGPSGAGKTTVINLLARLYDPTHGRITVDGVDLRQAEIYSWRRRLGFVSQDVMLFHGSIADNLRTVRPGASARELDEVLRLSGAEEFVKALPAGLDTTVGERGTALSGGERQRIALARALLQEPDVLVLDEATSHLDSLTERVIADTVARLRGRITIIAIAHRLNTLVNADQILVLQAGRIVETGRHEEISSASGLYHRLLSEQIKGLVPMGPH